METAFEDAKVTGHECLIASMTNDAKDRHVLAAAVRCGAHAIITASVKHFPMQALKSYDISVLKPDDFLVHQFHLNPELERLSHQAAVLQIPLPELLIRLGRHAPEFVDLAQGTGRS